MVSVTVVSWRDKNERGPWNRSRKSSAVIDILSPRSADRLALRALKLCGPYERGWEGSQDRSADRLALRALKLSAGLRCHAGVGVVSADRLALRALKLRWKTKNV
jgi:hypothetical protein